MTDHNHSDEISTLNTLIATTIDSITGYENSAKDIDSERFREIFRQRADERQQVVEQLRSEVRRLGGNPEDDGSFLGKTHQRFEDLKSAVTGQGRRHQRAAADAREADDESHAGAQGDVDRVEGHAASLSPSCWHGSPAAGKSSDDRARTSFQPLVRPSTGRGCNRAAARRAWPGVMNDTPSSAKNGRASA